MATQKYCNNNNNVIVTIQLAKGVTSGISLDFDHNIINNTFFLLWAISTCAE